MFKGLKLTAMEAFNQLRGNDVAVRECRLEKTLLQVEQAILAQGDKLRRKQPLSELGCEFWAHGISKSTENKDWLENNVKSRMTDVAKKNGLELSVSVYVPYYAQNCLVGIKLRTPGSWPVPVRSGWHP